MNHGEACDDGEEQESREDDPHHRDRLEYIDSFVCGLVWLVTIVSRDEIDVNYIFFKMGLLYNFSGTS